LGATFCIWRPDPGGYARGAGRAGRFPFTLMILWPVQPAHLRSGIMARLFVSGALTPPESGQPNGACALREGGIGRSLMWTRPALVNLNARPTSRTPEDAPTSLAGSSR